MLMLDMLRVSAGSGGRFYGYANWAGADEVWGSSPGAGSRHAIIGKGTLQHWDLES